MALNTPHSTTRLRISLTWKKAVIGTKNKTSSITHQSGHNKKETSTMSKSEFSPEQKKEIQRDIAYDIDQLKDEITHRVHHESRQWEALTDQVASLRRRIEDLERRSD